MPQRMKRKIQERKKMKSGIVALNEKVKNNKSKENVQMKG